jgi:hypothetical protein
MMNVLDQDIQPDRQAQPNSDHCQAVGRVAHPWQEHDLTAEGLGHRKGLHQGGLSQSRLARDEDHLADATERSGEPGVEACQCLFPPYQRDSTAHCGL